MMPFFIPSLPIDIGLPNPFIIPFFPNHPQMGPNVFGGICMGSRRLAVGASLCPTPLGLTQGAQHWALHLTSSGNQINGGALAGHMGLLAVPVLFRFRVYSSGMALLGLTWPCLSHASLA